MKEINSKEYWDGRFGTGDWDERGGSKQTKYFAELFQKNVPEWLTNYIRDRKLSVLDLGCARGEGTKVLSEMWSGQVSGADFSEEAVGLAQKQFSDIHFEVQDALNLKGEWDVIFISNVLEHFEKPFEVLSKIGAHAHCMVLILVPFEETADIDEHFARFTFDNIPLVKDKLTLVYYNDILDSADEYWGQQILLVYSADIELNHRISLKQSSSVLKSWTESHDYIRFKERLFSLMNEYAYVNKQLGAVGYQLQTSQNRISDLEQQLMESRAKATAYEEKLKDTEGEMQKLDDELKERNSAYDNLYAYSAHRDFELDTIKRSKSYRFFLRFIKPPLHIGNLIYLKLLRMIKYLFTLQFSLLAKEFSAPMQKLVRKRSGERQLKEQLTSLSRNLNGKNVIVMPPVLDWNMRLFQRPQQLAIAYSKKPNTVVIYMTANLKDDNVAVVEKAMDDLWLFNSSYTDQLVKIVKQAKTVVLSLSWTINKGYIEKINPDKLIYEYIDELEIFYGYDEQMVADHQKLMSVANVTVCTATKLFNKAREKAANPILSPNAGDYNFFAKTATCKINPLISKKVSQYRCVLGYYGALASWFDYELVKSVAERHPDWLFVLVGVNYDGTLDQSGINQFKNIVYIPPQPYQELPSFLTAFDIATIPFVINEITLSTSPVKLFEYMAGGKPILTSKMPECLKYESVRTYADADEFCRIVEEYMAMKPDDPYWATLKREALENTWDARTDQILEALHLQ